MKPADLQKKAERYADDLGKAVDRYLASQIVDVRFVNLLLQNAFTAGYRAGRRERPKGKKK